MLDLKFDFRLIFLIDFLAGSEIWFWFWFFMFDLTVLLIRHIGYNECYCCFLNNKINPYIFHHPYLFTSNLFYCFLYFINSYYILYMNNNNSEINVATTYREYYFVQIIFSSIMYIDFWNIDTRKYNKSKSWEFGNYLFSAS